MQHRIGGRAGAARTARRAGAQIPRRSWLGGLRERLDHEIETIVAKEHLVADEHCR